MSDGFWQDDTDEGHETPAMRVLREKAEADSKVIREMADRLAKMEKADNDRKALELVKAKGLDPKVLDLVPEGKDVDAFLADYGSLLAQKVETPPPADETDGSEGDGVPANEAAAQAAISGAASGAQPKAGLDATEAKLQSFDNAEDLLAFLQSQ